MITLFAVSASAFAADVAKKIELKDLPSCDLLLSGSDDQVARLFFANYALNYDDGLGVRGFMGPAIPNTPANVELAMENGLLWWGMKWNFAATIEEAIEHRLKARKLHEAKGTTFTDIIIAGQYFIGSEADLGLTLGEKDNQLPVPPEKVRELISRGAFEIDHLGNVTAVSPEQLARRISLNGMSYNKTGHLPGSFGKNSISQSGWVAFKQHGIHDYSTWKDSPEAKKLKKLARSLADRGYTIKFNTDFGAMLDKIKDQKRSYRDQEVGEDGQLIKRERKEQEAHHSRYKTESVYKAALSLLKAGKGYSVGLYDDRGLLVAGEIGFRHRNHLYGDSVFYDEVEHAKIAALALFEVMDAAGMPYTDPGMITAYTASMGAELIPFPEYLQKVKGGPRERIELPGVWDPRTSEHLDAAFGEIAKKKNQGIGNLKVTRRTPIASDEAAMAAAARAGLVRGSVNFVFVDSAEQAQAVLSSKAPSWSEMPVFVEGVPAAELRLALEAAPSGGDKIGPTISTLDFLRRVLTGPGAPGIKIYFIGSPRNPGVSKAVPLKQVVEMLELGVTSDMPSWVDGSSAPAIRVNGWGFKPMR